MRRISNCILLLASLLVATCQRSVTQTSKDLNKKPIAFDLAVSYNAEYARVAPDTCNCFWLQGGAVELSATVWKGWGVSGQFGFNSLTNYAPGLTLKKFDFMAGPHYLRNVYTFQGAKPHSLDIFGEGLFGSAHAYKGAFPSTSGLNQSADSFSLATGGGINLGLNEHLAWRVVQADYVRTSFPNNYSNTQNDLRLGSGLVIHF